MKATAAGLAAIACVAALVLSGCAALNPATRDTSAPDSLFSTESEGDYLLRMATRLRNSTNTDLQAEAETLQRAFAARRSEDNRVRLASFLAMAPAPFGDRGKALALLDVPRGEAAGRGRTHPYAAVLLPVLLDQRRAEEALVTSQARLKEEQKRSEALQQNVDTLRQNMDALQKSSDAMRQKLDAIRDIEKQLLERPPQR